MIVRSSESFVTENGKVYELTYNPAGQCYDRTEIAVEDLLNNFMAKEQALENELKYKQGQVNLYRNKLEDYVSGVNTAIKIMELMKNERLDRE